MIKSLSFKSLLSYLIMIIQKKKEIISAKNRFYVKRALKQTNLATSPRI
jgi:hypothetical protein